MNTRTIVTVMAVALLSRSLVPVSSAQDNHVSMPDGIEVITILAKRPVPTVATACVNGVTAPADAAAARHNGDGNFSAKALESSGTNINNPRRAFKRCMEQAATSFEAQI